MKSVCIMYTEKESLTKNRKKWKEIAVGRDVKMKNDCNAKKNKRQRRKNKHSTKHTPP